MINLRHILVKLRLWRQRKVLGQKKHITCKGKKVGWNQTSQKHHTEMDISEKTLEV